MSSQLLDAIAISAHGMRAQGTRVRVATENIANADTAASTPGGNPYTRQTISFKNELDKTSGVDFVQVDKIGTDTKTPFRTEYRPDSPGADKDGYVKLPNVNLMMEMMDVKEAQRSYEANLGMIDQAKSMVMRTIDLLRA